MGNYHANLHSNDLIATKGLPNSDQVIKSLNEQIRNGNNHGKNELVINLNYPSANLGYPIHDDARLELDYKIAKHLENNFICDYRLTNDFRYHRIVTMKHVACYCDQCVSKYKVF
jgi:hypothetical protein